MSGILYVSQKGYDDMLAELAELKKFRRENAERIDVARQHGDLSENAEYHAAKEAHLLNEIKINELQDKISRASVMDASEISTDEATLGTKVTIKDESTGEKEVYSLVSEVESDYDQGKISTNSPIGQGLLGKKKGEIAEITVPAGVLKYKIMKIEAQ